MTRQQGLQRRTGGNSVGGCEGTSLVTTPPLQLLSFLSIRVFLVGLFLASCIFINILLSTTLTSRLYLDTLTLSRPQIMGDDILIRDVC